MNYINHMKNLMKTEILSFWSILKILQDFYNYSMGREMTATPVLNFEEYDKSLEELELMQKEEDSQNVTFPKIDFLYEQAELLLVPQEEQA